MRHRRPQHTEHFIALRHAGAERLQARLLALRNVFEFESVGAQLLDLLALQLAVFSELLLALHELHTQPATNTSPPNWDRFTYAYVRKNSPKNKKQKRKKERKKERKKGKNVKCDDRD